MTTPLELIATYFFGSKKTNDSVLAKLNLKKADSEKQIVYGEVYAPDVIDTHGDAMAADEIEALAHAFLAESLNTRIDLMHNNKPVGAVVVESFIARAGDTDFVEGSWVVATKIPDKKLWAEIKQGKYSGYSMEVMVRKIPTTVDMLLQKTAFGIVEENNGHYHAFYIELDDNARVVGGRTSEDEGHYHEIKIGTAVEFADEHTHRYFIP